MYVRASGRSIRRHHQNEKGHEMRSSAPEYVIEAPKNWIANGSSETVRRRLIILRVAIVTNLVLGLNYLIWRYLFSINVHALWFAIPMIVAETYSILGNGLFCITLWKPTQRRPVPLSRFILAFRRVN